MKSLAASVCRDAARAAPSPPPLTWTWFVVTATFEKLGATCNGAYGLRLTAPATSAASPGTGSWSPDRGLRPPAGTLHPFASISPSSGTVVPVEPFGCVHNLFPPPPPSMILCAEVLSSPSSSTWFLALKLNLFHVRESGSDYFASRGPVGLTALNLRRHARIFTI